MTVKGENILLFQRIIPEYRKAIFRYLHNSLGIIVCYSDYTKDMKSVSLDFPSENISKIYYGKSQTAILQNPLPKIFKYKPKIIISEGSTSYGTVWLLVLFRLFFRYKLIIWSHGVKSHQSNAPFQGFSGKLRLFLFNTADAILLYSKTPLKVLSGIVNNPTKIFVAENSIDTDAMNRLYQKLNDKGKYAVKSELGWKHTYNLIFVGRLLKSKGLQQIVEIFELLPVDFDTALHIIGDGPEMSFIKEKAIHNSKIFCYGACFNDEQIGKYFYAADLLLMPKAVGLTIVHAFSFGCPIVSCENVPGDSLSRHGPEFEYLINNVNGIIVENDSILIASQIVELLKDTERYDFFSEQALNIEKKVSMEKMSEGFKNAINYLSNK
ncbi:glycosyltransferase family 4 protein [Taibaiella lutea]|uniref:Glycosyltransferase family 4 protein n=1 Tax=Taibaiella lutea TaxID=2608001 RepID=A0A5M6CM01_9BACT|nr:glycosyltransferase [Taibaiella lutea]KAA5536248.1 glycosyltransferase family 4 protein [Taibaiella lutea]